MSQEKQSNFLHSNPVSRPKLQAVLEKVGKGRRINSRLASFLKNKPITFDRSQAQQRNAASYAEHRNNLIF
ncbi:hypothetical protein [Pseudomonas fluorescens]|uniref:hypothetical protein n=1 Tax=Pseudomonas fluorescens TaxID=294 RepID=UPI00123F5D72|nr:hypothetical protein [Pseudomonas fluorescens]